MITRKPAVAGAFYSEKPDHLSAQIQSFLNEVPLLEVKHPLGFVVPHAGYIYSGPVAAHAYKHLQEKSFKKVLILAPSHFDSFDGLSIYSGDGLETPLGVVSVSKKDREDLVKTNGIFSSELGFGQEHSLEVQLPFLQHVLEPGWKVIPIIMGYQQRTTVELAARILFNFFSERNLVVISSDLSHYYPYAEAKRIDQRFCELVKSGDLETLWEKYRKHKVEACGFGPVLSFLTALKDRTDVSIEILDCRNSGDTAGPKDQVVGYCAIGAFLRSG